MAMKQTKNIREPMRDKSFPLKTNHVKKYIFVKHRHRRNVMRHRSFSPFNVLIITSLTIFAFLLFSFSWYFKTALTLKSIFIPISHKILCTHLYLFSSAVIHLFHFIHFCEILSIFVHFIHHYQNIHFHPPLLISIQLIKYYL